MSRSPLLRDHEMLTREAERLLLLDQEIGASRLGISLDRNPANQEWQFGGHEWAPRHLRAGTVSL